MNCKHERYTLKLPAIAATNVEPTLRGQAHAMCDRSGRFSLAHDKVGGVELMVWFFSGAMNQWVRAFPAGGGEVVPAGTLFDFDVPSRAPIYIQTSLPCNVYLGGVLDKFGGVYDANPQT